MSPNLQIAAFGGLAIALIAVAIYVIKRIRGNPQKREQKRRLEVNRLGRLGDALISEVGENELYYSYSVSGVHYTASQDISTLREKLPAEPEKLIGHASLKYAPRNPANSILICEDWSGLRPAERKTNITQ